MRLVVGIAFLGLSLGAQTASAEPYRLRADAYGQAQAPIGLIALDGRGQLADWATAEAMIWGGQSEFGGELDALVINVGLRSPKGWGEARLGRMIIQAGAIRPVHTDGAYAIGRILPSHTTVEVFGGSPVTPNFESRGADWLVGGRIAQSIPRIATLGVGYLHRNEDGYLSDQEIAGDLLITPTDRIDVTARAAWDLINPGFSEIASNLALRLGDWRVEAFGTYRSAQRILPATSLFSVLGDIASSAVGGRVRWRAAPRLDVSASAATRRYEGESGEDLNLRALLRTDAEGKGHLGLEFSRLGVPGAEWTGVRGFARIPFFDRFAASTELEIVVPDDDSRGSVWPWGLVALSWTPIDVLEVAAAFEASASAEYTESFDGLLRVTYLWSSDR